MRIIESTDSAALTRLVTRDLARDPAVLRTASRIVRDVRRRGDAAVRDWARRLGDTASSGDFDVPRRAWRSAADGLAREVRQAIRLAARNIERVADRQRLEPFTIHVRPGVTIRQRAQPFDRVGCYVPGGRHPLPSTLLMTVIPARVAGVREVIVACPDPAPVVLCAALEAGATRVLRIGGAQAIAALAYGTTTIARVSKIAGPGNAWVAAAKELVSADCGIDLHAGPSEIVVWADAGRFDWIAADLLAQAEHDPAARPILVTRSRRLARAVAAEVTRRLTPMSPARTSVRRSGAIIVSRGRRESSDIVNRIAPEHLVCANAKDASLIQAAGTIFIGPWSAQAAGDYTTGSNHVLPTGGAARFRGGLGPADFVRIFTEQTVTRRGLRAIGPAAATLADAEGLTEHARSIRIRL
jgi:histidinol dehydrogenase